MEEFCTFRPKCCLAPLPHLFPGLDKLLNIPGTREVPRPDAAGEMSASVEVLDGGPAHHP